MVHVKDDVLFDAATGPSVGRNELADKVYTTGRGLTRAEARTLVDQVLEEIVDGLTHDGKVLLTGFGHFAVSAKHARVGRNPRTGEEYPIVARRVVKFRAAAQLRAAVVAGEKREIRARKRVVQARISTRASAARHNEMPA
jgi:integration host factor subunit alpha